MHHRGSPSFAEADLLREQQMGPRDCRASRDVQNRARRGATGRSALSTHPGAAQTGGVAERRGECFRGLSRQYSAVDSGTRPQPPDAEAPQRGRHRRCQNHRRIRVCSPKGPQCLSTFESASFGHPTKGCDLWHQAQSIPYSFKAAEKSFHHVLQTLNRARYRRHIA